MLPCTFGCVCVLLLTLKGLIIGLKNKMDCLINKVFLYIRKVSEYEVFILFGCLIQNKSILYLSKNGLSHGFINKAQPAKTDKR